MENNKTGKQQDCSKLRNKDSDDKDRIWIRSPGWLRAAVWERGMVWLLKQGSGIHDLNNGKCDLWSWIKINSACVLSHFSHVWFFVTPWIIVCQALLSMEFSRQEYWSGLPLPPLILIATSSFTRVSSSKAWLCFDITYCPGGMTKTNPEGGGRIGGCMLSCEAKTTVLFSSMREEVVSKC